MGSIAKSYGVKGWMKIYSYTNPRCNIIDYSRLWILEIKGKNIYFKVKRIRLVNRFIIVKLYGIKTREKAKKLIGSLIKLPKNKEEYFLQSVIRRTVAEKGIIRRHFQYLEKASRFSKNNGDEYE